MSKKNDNLDVLLLLLTTLVTEIFIAIIVSRHHGANTPSNEINYLR